MLQVLVMDGRDGFGNDDGDVLTQDVTLGVTEQVLDCTAEQTCGRYYYMSDDTALKMMHVYGAQTSAVGVDYCAESLQRVANGKNADLQGAYGTTSRTPQVNRIKTDIRAVNLMQVAYILSRGVQSTALPQHRSTRNQSSCKPESAQEINRMCNSLDNET